MTHVEELCIKGCTDTDHHYLHQETSTVFEKWEVFALVLPECFPTTPLWGCGMPLQAPGWTQSMCLWRRIRLSHWHRDPTPVLGFLSLGTENTFLPVVSMANTASSRLHHQALFLWVSLGFLESLIPFCTASLFSFMAHQGSSCLESRSSPTDYELVVEGHGEKGGRPSYSQFAMSSFFLSLSFLICKLRMIAVSMTEIRAVVRFKGNEPRHIKHLEQLPVVSKCSINFNSCNAYL